MNNKEIIKHFYEVVVSRNLLNELPCYVSEDCSHRTGNASTPIGMDAAYREVERIPIYGFDWFSIK